MDLWNAATGQIVAVMDYNPLSGAGEKPVPYFGQNLVQVRSEKWKGTNVRMPTPEQILATRKTGEWTGCQSNYAR
jgi:hypothetical protein